MKKLLLFLFFLPVLSFSQVQYSNYLGQYQDSLQSELQKYDDDKTIQDSLLNENIDEVLKSVIFGNNDFTTNASSFSFQQGEDKTTITASVNHPITKSAGKKQVFLKSGVFAKGKENVFNLYSSDSWQNEIGANLGLIFKFYGSKNYKSGKKLKLVQQRREYFTDSLIHAKRPVLIDKYNKLKSDTVLVEKIYQLRVLGQTYQEIKNNLPNGPDQKLVDRIQKKGLLAIKDSLNSELQKLGFFKKFENREKKEDEKKLLESVNSWLEEGLNFNQIVKTKPLSKKELLYVEKLKEEYNENKQVVKDSIKALDKELDNEPEEIKSLVGKELYLFDKKNNPTYGYHLGWCDLNLAASNATYNLPNDTIVDTAILNNLGLEKFDSRLKLKLGLNFNYTADYEKTLFFVQTGTTLSIGNFLDNNLLEGSPKFLEQDNGYSIIDEDGNVLGDYSNLDQNFSYFSPHIYASIFFSKKKNIGLDVSYMYNMPVEIPKDLEYPQNKTVTLGLLFRNVGENDLAKTTFGLEAGFENVPGDQYNDYFFTRLKIGVPFNIYSSKKSKS